MPWTHDLRCLECRAEYSASPRDVFIGPLHDEVVTGREVIDGIEVLRTKRLYTGAITLVACPSCLLRIHIASDLVPPSLKQYLDYQADRFEGLRMDQVFETLGAHSLVRPFPMRCPRCETPISSANQPKACQECGATQLQTIRSSNG